MICYLSQALPNRPDVDNKEEDNQQCGNPCARRNCSGNEKIEKSRKDPGKEQAINAHALAVNNHQCAGSAE